MCWFSPSTSVFPIIDNSNTAAFGSENYNEHTVPAFNLSVRQTFVYDGRYACCISSMYHMYTTDFAYDGPIFLAPSSPSYASSPV